MLEERLHPVDIIKYINENFTTRLQGSMKDSFIQSMMKPELLKPQRYISYFPTKTFYIKESFVSTGSEITFKWDLLFDKESLNSSLVIDNNKSNLLKIHKDIVKLYRITAACILIQGDFVYNNKIYSNNKIVYIPESFNNLNYKFINLDESNQMVTIKPSVNSKVTLIQHVEFVPVRKNMFCMKSQPRDMQINDLLYKFKALMITDYNAEDLVPKIRRKFKAKKLND
jgi:hypothetical protein